MYLDYAATHPWLSSKASTALYNRLTLSNQDYIANPSSQYTSGIQARNVIEDARELIANKLHCKPNEIIFTSGGSEGNSMVIKSFDEIFCSKYEHSSVIKAIDDSPYEILLSNMIIETFLNDLVLDQEVDDFVKYNAHIFRDNHTKLFSIMAVNNETGHILNIPKISRTIKEYCNNYALVHTDAVQLLPYVPIDIRDYPDVDYMTFSGHKIGAPKGIGFIYAKESSQKYLRPLISGEQENNLRGGTENVLYIEALAKTIDGLYAEFKNNDTEYDAIKARTFRRFLTHYAKQNDVKMDFFNYKHLDYYIIPEIISVTFPEVNASHLVTYLDEHYNIQVSNGSACNSGSSEPSRVLLNYGYSTQEALSTIRISYSLHPLISTAQIERTCKNIIQAVVTLKKYSNNKEECDCQNME